MTSTPCTTGCATIYGPLSERERWENQHGGFLFPEVIPGTFTPVANKSNDYQIDRLMQRNYSYTGIKSFPIQDLAMIEDQWGPIADRTQEHLVSSDEAIIRVRRNILKAAKELSRGSNQPSPDPRGDTCAAQPYGLIGRGGCGRSVATPYASSPVDDVGRHDIGTQT